jgi:hypothetical protein
MKPNRLGKYSENKVKKIIFATYGLFYVSLSFAAAICELTQVKKVSETALSLKIGSTPEQIIRTDHNVNGWALSMSGNWFVVYGAYPTNYQFLKMTEKEQENFVGKVPSLKVSILKGSKIKRIWSQELFQDGGSIYEITMDASEGNIFLSRPGGIVQINTMTKRKKNIGDDSDFFNKNNRSICNGVFN